MVGKMTECDHIIGVDSYGWALKAKSGDKYYPEIDNEFFDYCPKCGEKLEKEGAK